MQNNTKAQMTKIQNKMSFGIWIWNLEFKVVEMPKIERKIKIKRPLHVIGMGQFNPQKLAVLIALAHGR